MTEKPQYTSLYLERRFHKYEGIFPGENRSVHTCLTIGRRDP